MTRTVIISSILFLAACGAKDRVLTGTLPADADGAFALAGNQRIDAATDGKQVTLDLADVGRVEVFVDAQGATWPLVFPSSPAAMTWQAGIPSFTGTIDLGELVLIDAMLLRGAEDDDHAESENNPLESIDCDEDGDADFEDEDDDDDGIDDDDDDEHENQCGHQDDDDDDNEQEGENEDDD